MQEKIAIFRKEPVSIKKQIRHAGNLRTKMPGEEVR